MRIAFTSAEFAAAIASGEPVVVADDVSIAADDAANIRTLASVTMGRGCRVHGAAGIVRDQYNAYVAAGRVPGRFDDAGVFVANAEKTTAPTVARVVTSDDDEPTREDAANLWHALACLGGLRQCVGDFQTADMKPPADRVAAVRASLDTLAGELCERAHHAQFREVFPAFSTAFDRKNARGKR
jgi:hypothetical protein